MGTGAAVGAGLGVASYFSGQDSARRGERTMKNASKDARRQQAMMIEQYEKAVKDLEACDNIGQLVRMLVFPEKREVARYRLPF